jgi:small GTP-binding protein
LEIWDTAGQEQYLSLVPMYLRGASVAIMICAANDPESIPGMDRWFEQIKNSDPTLPVVVGINKSDLVEDLTSLDSIYTNLSSRFSNVFFCSAQRGDGIEEMFSAAAGRCLELRRSAPLAEAQPMNERAPESNGDCC